jgi:hypothetical protein
MEKYKNLLIESITRNHYFTNEDIIISILTSELD